MDQDFFSINLKSHPNNPRITPPNRPHITYTKRNPIDNEASDPALPFDAAAIWNVTVLHMPKHTKLNMLSNVQAAISVLAIPFSLPYPRSLSLSIWVATMAVATDPAAKPIEYDTSIGILKMPIPINAYVVASKNAGNIESNRTDIPFP